MNFYPPIYPPIISVFVWITEDLSGLENKKSPIYRGVCGCLRIAQGTIRYSGSALVPAQLTPLTRLHFG